MVGRNYACYFSQMSPESQKPSICPCHTVRQLNVEIKLSIMACGIPDCASLLCN